ncbi:MAG: glycosyltransferase family 39 protein, partial [Bacteroidetes bacterium]|nr:glycosyltransferase family 39 protein [Bacteroidota bacterium]
MTLSHTFRSAIDRTTAALRDLRNLHHTHPGLFVILVFTLMTRAAIYVVGQPWDDEVITNTILDGDGLVYHRIALEFLNGTPISEMTWAADRTFGYPYFVTAIYAISNNGIWLVLAVQSFMNFLMVPIVYGIARSVFSSHRAGTISAGLFALSAVAAWWASRELFTETLFTLILMMFIIVFLHSWKRTSVRWFLLLGILLGVGAVIRPVLQYFVLIPIFIILLQDRSLRSKITVVGFLIVGLMATLAPWQARNFINYGHYS